MCFFFGLIYSLHLAREQSDRVRPPGAGPAGAGSFAVAEIMRIAVMSDTHLRRMSDRFKDLLERYLLDTDVVFHVGDFTSPSIVEYLSERPFYGVCGNMDPFEIKSELPETRVVELGGHRFGLIHGWGPPEGLEERVMRCFTDVDVVVYGHSHTAVNHVKGGVLVFNPGTACGQSAGDFHSVGILECEQTVRGEIVRVDLS